MDMQVANRLDEAAGGIYQGSEKFFLAVSFQAELNGMIAENKQREIEGHSMAYTEEAFIKLKETYEKEFSKL